MLNAAISIYAPLFFKKIAQYINKLTFFVDLF